MRYFLVTYSFYKNDNTNGTGYIALESVTFPSIQLLKEKCLVTNLEGVYPITIMEFNNEIDYNDFKDGIKKDLISIDQEIEHIEQVILTAQRQLISLNEFKFAKKSNNSKLLEEAIENLTKNENSIIDSIKTYQKCYWRNNNEN